MFYQLFKSGVRLEQDDNSPVAVVAGGSNTKAGYAELISSLPSNVLGVVAVCHRFLTYTDHLVDVVVGAAGSEEILVSDLYVGGHEVYADTAGFFFVIPLPLPAGSRVSARAQCASDFAGSVYMTAIPIVGNDLVTSAPFGAVDTYGANTSESNGTDVSITAGSFSSWVELSSGITSSLKAFCLAFVDNETSASTFFSGKVEVGVGSAGNEVAIVDGMPLRVHWEAGENNVGACTPNYTPFFPVPIVAGSRVAVRIKGSINYSVGVIMYGLR